MPDYGRDEVADHTLALALSLLRGVVVLDRSVRDGAWDLAPARPLRRLRPSPGGWSAAGPSARAVAGRAAGLGMRVLGYDLPQVPSEPPIERVPGWRSCWRRPTWSRCTPPSPPSRTT